MAILQCLKDELKNYKKKAFTFYFTTQKGACYLMFGKFFQKILKAELPISWEEGPDGIQRRYLEDIDLLEVSILDKTPAYIATTIEQRGEEDVLTETRGEDFKAVIEDNSPEERQKGQIDYSVYEKEIEFIKMKGGK